MTPWPLLDQFNALAQPQIGFIVDSKGIIEYANSDAENFFQAPSVRLVGRDFRELSHPASMGLTSLVHKQLSEGSIDNYTLAPKTKWVDFYGNVIEGKWFANRVICDGEVKLYFGLTPSVVEKEQEYVAFGMPGRWWRGAADFVKSVDGWKLLIVVSGLILVVWILQDYIPILFGS